MQLAHNTFKIHGFIIKLSDIINYLGNQCDSIEIFALDRILIDFDVILNENTNFIIFSPIWTVVGSHSINLNGKNADKFLENRAKSLNGNVQILNVKLLAVLGNEKYFLKNDAKNFLENQYKATGSSRQVGWEFLWAYR